MIDFSNLKDRSWYWIYIDGYNKPTPCWLSIDRYDINDSYFLPGGMGDGSSMGLYSRDVDRVGPEIIEPKF